MTFGYWISIATHLTFFNVKLCQIIVILGHFRLFFTCFFQYLTPTNKKSDNLFILIWLFRSTPNSLISFIQQYLKLFIFWGQIMLIYLFWFIWFGFMIWITSFWVNMKMLITDFYISEKSKLSRNINNVISLGYSKGAVLPPLSMPMPVKLALTSIIYRGLARVKINGETHRLVLE